MIIIIKLFTRESLSNFSKLSGKLTINNYSIQVTSTISIQNKKYFYLLMQNILFENVNIS